MKNYIKKIIVGMFGFALLLVAQNAFAATWNGASNDCRGISIANATTQEGFVNPCWPSASVSADAGDTINVRIYYHNTGTVTANASVYLNAPSGASTSHSFSGSIISDQGALSLGTVKVNLSSSQALTFNSAKWYTNNTRATLTSLLYGQDGSEIVDGELRLGPIGPGWSTQGSVVVSFHVSNTDDNDPVDNNDCKITKFKTDDTSIEDGDEAILEWDTDGCDYVDIAGVGNDLNDSGTKKVSPSSTKTYTLKAYDDNGDLGDTDTVKITVDDNESNNDCKITNFDADDTSLKNGEFTILDWDTKGCDYVDISGVGNDLNDSGTKVVYPNSTKTYTLKAYDDNDDLGDTDTVKISVSDNNTYRPIVVPVYNSCAVTTVATNISRDSASLNGIITNSNVSNATYFEYGPSVNLGSRTGTRSISGNGTFSEFVTGLPSNAIYYFRAVADCGNATSRGAIEVFKTLGATVTRPIVVQGTTVIGTSSPIMLDISNRYQTIGKGDTIDYTVNYKNIGNATLRDAILQVVVPNNITITNSSEGTYSNENNTLTVELGDLSSGESGVVYLQGEVISVNEENAQIVTTALLVYTNTSNAQENAMAYVLNTPKLNGGSNLGAAAFFGGIFPTTLCGWLLLIIIILLIILIIRKYYYAGTSTSTRTVVSDTHDSTISKQ